MSYKPNRKFIDVKITEWESMHDCEKQTCSMPMYCVNEYAKDLMQKLLDNGFDEKKAKETLKRLLEPA